MGVGQGLGVSENWNLPDSSLCQSHCQISTKSVTLCVSCVAMFTSDCMHTRPTPENGNYLTMFSGSLKTKFQPSPQNGL
jgi:hypothetical protein